MGVSSMRYIIMIDILVDFVILRAKAKTYSCNSKHFGLNGNFN